MAFVGLIAPHIARLVVRNGFLVRHLSLFAVGAAWWSRLICWREPCFDPPIFRPGFCGAGRRAVLFMAAHPAANVTDEENVSLTTQKLSISYQQQQVIDSLDLALPAAKVSVLIGSNGCGKSTLLKAMARLLTPQSGTVILEGGHSHQ
jgi:ABC-type multidrug transport system fused ATPase/permease subunit